MRLPIERVANAEALNRALRAAGGGSSVLPWLVVLAALACALSIASPLASAQGASSPYLGRPIYSEPGSGLQLPPGCTVEPSWRAKLGTSDFEVWVADCSGTAHAWLIRRAVIEALSGNQARLRFQVLDERVLEGQVAGDTVSVQCTGRQANDPGYVVIGAKWRTAGAELKLNGATGALRADRAGQKFLDTAVTAVDCTRFPSREAMMRRLQQETR